MQLHLDLFVPGVMRAVSDGIDQYLALAKKRSLGSATIVITDSADFAANAVESNDIVIMISSIPETAIRGIFVVGPDTKEIARIVCAACTGKAL